jgi:hypothetical protein
MVDHVFSATSLKRLYLHTLEWNTRARHSFQKVGFLECGTVQRDGRSFVKMELTRERWMSLREGQLQSIKNAGAPRKMEQISTKDASGLSERVQHS